MKSQAWFAQVTCGAVLSLAALVPSLCDAHVTSVVATNDHSQFGGSLIPAPASVADDVLVDHGDVFEEQNDVVLGVPLHTDTNGFLHGIPGRYTTGIVVLDPGVIPAGTTVSSIMIHFDHVPAPLAFTDSAAFNVFTDEDIIGVILSDDLLDESDLIVGAPGTIYPHGLALRGTTVDPTEGDDDIAVGVPGDVVGGYSQSVFVLSMEVGAVLDEMRIITTPHVPEPPTASLFAAGCALCFIERRRWVPG
jgi:hypothetical protein